MKISDASSIIEIISVNSFNLISHIISDSN